jgi:LysW-gamma-L-lysine carboxypeptidase
MATYGPGDSSLDHADDEHIVLSDYLRGIDVLAIAISELAHLPVRADDRTGAAPLPLRSLR